jgi:error-prone DNA polymerase
LLGNRSLGVIRDAMANVRENGDFDEYRWEPEDDPATQGRGPGPHHGLLLHRKPGHAPAAAKAGVGDFEHLVIHSSIIRPAANDLSRSTSAASTAAAWEPIHPLLTDVLDETFGIMVYQEDVSRAAVALAGFRCRSRRPAQDHVQKRPASGASKTTAGSFSTEPCSAVSPGNKLRRYGP